MADAAALHAEMIDLVNSRDMARFRELLHPEYSYTGANGAEMPGVDVGVGVVETFTAAFPDLVLTPLHQMASGDVSVIEFRATGTHQAELEGIPAKGKAIDVVVCDVMEFRDGRVYREREYYDQVTMMQQLGVMPAE